MFRESCSACPPESATKGVGQGRAGEWTRGRGGSSGQGRAGQEEGGGEPLYGAQLAASFNARSTALARSCENGKGGGAIHFKCSATY